MDFVPPRFLAMGVLIAVLLTGTAAEPAHKAIKGDAAPTAARSVHLSYPAPDGSLFFTEMFIEKSVPGSYFMAAGWNTGYFGLQQLGKADEKVVIFSVWDPTTGDDPGAVRSEDRVEVLHEGPGVRIRRFGGEGTGGQCMAPWPWAIGETNRFLLQGEVQGNKTAYTAWVARTGSDWKKLATFRTRTGGMPLRGYYSFVEDFRRDGSSVGETRKARFGNGWVKTTSQDWVPLNRARFTASGADWEARDNIDGGASGTWFFLATGGDIQSSHPLQSLLRLSPPMALPEFETP